MKNLLLSLSLLLFIPIFSWGHAVDQTYLYLRIYENSVEGTMEITFKDLNTALNLDLQRGMTVEDLKPHLGAIQNYINERVSLKTGAIMHPLQFEEPELMEVKIAVFLKYNFSLPSMDPIPDAVDVDYNILFDKNPDHQGLLVIAHHWKSGIVNNEAIPSLLFSNGKRKDILELKDASIWKGLFNMIKLGVWHIWIGLDHILFLLALVLPAVVRRREQPDGTTKWVAVDDFKSAFWYIIKIVTWFTIAHSITLSLAALGIINLSSRFVESIIAFSIALAALHNIRPIFGNKEWLIALGFGLFHGLGFASVLGDKGLNGDYMTLSLVGFNVGVEIGQLFIIAIIFPILFLLRRKNIYKDIIHYGSILLIIIGMYWFVERFFEVDFIIDNYIYKAFRKVISLFG